MIYTHVLSSSAAGTRSPLDALPVLTEEMTSTSSRYEVCEEPTAYLLHEGLPVCDGNSLKVDARAVAFQWAESGEIAPALSLAGARLRQLALSKIVPDDFVEPTMP